MTRWCPNVKFDKPGKSPFMDMELVPVYADEASGGAQVKVSANAAQNLGVRLGKVERASLERSTFRGRYGRVRRGIARARAGTRRRICFSPAREDDAGAGSSRAAAGRCRGARLARGSGRIRRAARRDLFARRGDSRGGAPATRRAGRAGRVRSVEAGNRTQDDRVDDYLFAGGWGRRGTRRARWRVVPAGRAAVSHQFAAQGLGGRADPGNPGERGRILARRSPCALPRGLAKSSAAAWWQSCRTSTPPHARCRCAWRSTIRGSRLVPGMFVSLDFAAPATTPQLVVPSEAVMVTGERSVVIVARDGGGFDVVDVKLGAELAGKTVILSGLNEGQSVVLSGQFLIDSEASLKSAVSRCRVSTPAGRRIGRHGSAGESRDCGTHPLVARESLPGVARDACWSPPGECCPSRARHSMRFRICPMCRSSFARRIPDRRRASSRTRSPIH